MAEAQTTTAAERTKELTDRLEAGIQDLLQSDKYMQYLKSMSQFHRYSTRNTLLIHMQNPNATRVASFKLWEEKFNRHVKKGEKSIRIFAPISPPPEKKLMEKLDPDTGAPILDTDGKPIMEEMTALSRPRFKLVPVFDESQTYGEPLPEIVDNLTGNVEQYEAFLDSLREVSPLPIEFELLADNNDGYCRYGEKIGIREGMSEVQTVSAVVHEITHARLHDKNAVAETPDNSEADSAKTRKMKEVEAESVSYVVCQHFGIETSPNSFGYLAEWGSDDMREFKASLDTIRKESNALITVLDERFKAICKERSIDLSAKEPEQAAPEVATADQPAEPSFTTATRTENIAGVDFPVTDVIPSESPKETRPIGDTVLMPLVYNNDGNFERTTKRTKVKIEPPIGKYSVYSREMNGLDTPYFYLLTDSGRLTSIYGAGNYGGQSPDTVTEQSIDSYFATARAAVDKGLQDPSAWVDFNHAAIADRLDEADKHNQPIRESREAARTQKAQEWQAQQDAEKAEVEQLFSNRVDEMAQGLVNGERIDNMIDRYAGKNPLFTLFDRHSVELPLATKGWVNRNLKAMQVVDGDTYRMWLPKSIKPSQSFINAIAELKDKIAADLSPQIPETPAADIIPEQQTLFSAQEPSEIMPDTSITTAERDNYGYTSEDMLPLRGDRALELFDADSTIYMLHPDGTETMIFDRDEIENYLDIFGIEREDWQKTADYAELAAQSTEAAKDSNLIHGGMGSFAIYQLKDSEELRYHQFASLNQLKADNLTVDTDNYNRVYVTNLLADETPEKIYRELSHGLPYNFEGRNIAVSDVIVIQHDGEITAHYVDNNDKLVELPAFLGNEKQSEVVAATEQEKPMATPVIQTTLSAMLGLNLADGKTPPPIDEPPTVPPAVYRESLAYVREHDEFDKYRADVKLNTECRDAIHTAINESRYDTHFYKMKDAVKQVIDTYGAERVELIMAKIVQGADWDGRYSRQNKEWAKGFGIPQSMKDIYSNTHPILLDGFLNKVREKPSVLEALKANAEKSRHQSEPKPDTKKTKEMEM